MDPAFKAAMDAALQSPVRAPYRPPSPVQDAYPLERILSFVALSTCSFITANNFHRGDIDGDEESFDFTFNVPLDAPCSSAEESEDGEESEEEDTLNSYLMNPNPLRFPNLEALRDEYVGLDLLSTYTYKDISVDFRRINKLPTARAESELGSSSIFSDARLTMDPTR